MRSSATSVAFVVALVASGVATYGCSSDTGTGNTNPFTSGGTAGTAGTPTAGVGTGGTAAGTGGVVTGGGMAGNITGGTAGGGGTPMGGMSGGGAGGGSGGGTGMDIRTVWKSDGCGMQYAMSGQSQAIGTMGTKDAMCADALNGQPKCGPWGQASSTWQQTPLARQYRVNLPQNYDPMKAYPLVLEGPGCGSHEGDVYPLDNNGGGAFIRVGLNPPPTSIGHGTNPGDGCFDDKEGDDSVDWVFYENLYDLLNTQICFDRNRVFSSGNSSGAWFSNEIGCKYAGDAKRPIRGIMPNTGGLPTDPKWVPTCTTKPMSGMWVHEIMDPTNPFTGNKVAISRAMKVNGCMGAQDYDAAVSANQVENFDIPGVAAGTCQKIKGCPDLYPLVVCPLSGMGHGSHDNVANPGFSFFVKMFSGTGFLTQ